MSEVLSEHPAAAYYRQHYRDMDPSMGKAAAWALWSLNESWWQVIHGRRDAALRRITDGR